MEYEFICAVLNAKNLIKMLSSLNVLMLVKFILFFLLSLLFLLLFVLNVGLHSFCLITTYTVIFSVLKILFVFIIVAFFTLVERKVLGAIHRRRGPSLVGIFGLLQPIADALKLFFKELLYPVRAQNFIFLTAP